MEQEQEQTFTELILESIGNGQRQQAIDQFLSMRKDQKREVLRSLAEGVYMKDRVAGEAPLCYSALCILIQQIFR